MIDCIEKIIMDALTDDYWSEDSAFRDGLRKRFCLPEDFQSDSFVDNVILAMSADQNVVTVDLGLCKYEITIKEVTPCKVIVQGDIVYYNAAVSMMDDDIREELCFALAPCSPQEFVDEYCKQHYKKFGEVFQVV